jgi:hypothetical protein
MIRYSCQGRSGWVPAQYVVVDSATGEIVSRHQSAAAAEDAALGMNAAPTRTGRGWPEAHTAAGGLLDAAAMFRPVD